MAQPLGVYHIASILQGFKHQEAPIQSLHHQEVHQTYNTGCNMDNDHRYGSLFTLMHAEYRVEIHDFMKKCKFAPRVRMKSGTTKLLTIEEWWSNSGILCHTTKLLGFILFAENGIKGCSNCALLCIPDGYTKLESTP